MPVSLYRSKVFCQFDFYTERLFEFLRFNSQHILQSIGAFNNTIYFFEKAVNPFRILWYIVKLLCVLYRKTKVIIQWNFRFVSVEFFCLLAGNLTFCSNYCLQKTSMFCMCVWGVISVRKKFMSKPQILCAFLRKISSVEFLPREPFNHAAHFDRSAKIILRQSNRKKKYIRFPICEMKEAHSRSNLRNICLTDSTRLATTKALWRERAIFPAMRGEKFKFTVVPSLCAISLFIDQRLCGGAYLV